EDLARAISPSRARITSPHLFTRPKNFLENAARRLAPPYPHESRVPRVRRIARSIRGGPWASAGDRTSSRGHSRAHGALRPRGAGEIAPGERTDILLQGRRYATPFIRPLLPRPHLRL